MKFNYKILKDRQGIDTSVYKELLQIKENKAVNS